ncbi:MAG TPA: hypothetical protein VNE41_12545 [Chitinophagaceae bacterium]|nr:hypothetical protein [Chitinophagaceae bacterium]
MSELERLRANAQKEVPLEKWGPYLSERQWGTVREDYSANGTAWEYFPHDHARSRAYRWGEDGIGGICDMNQLLCFALAMWNGKDPILKERLFGLTGNEGNHGEDVKELYYYLDNTPTHYYMKCLYKYPQEAYPYDDLVTTNRNRTRADPEYELLDTGAFRDNKYFDVFIEYAKYHSEDIAIRVEIFNRGPAEAGITLLPTLWFRNQWSFTKEHERPVIRKLYGLKGFSGVQAVHQKLGDYYLYFQEPDRLLFTENDTNLERLYGVQNPSPLVKDAFHQVITQGREVLPVGTNSGTKIAPVYQLRIPAGASQKILLRLCNQPLPSAPFNAGSEDIFDLRRKEADDFYSRFLSEKLPPAIAGIQRQAFSGLLWSKQYYHYDIETWLNGDPLEPPPPEQRKTGRNSQWKYLKNQDILSIPDKWEYPWYAAWDLAFHCIPMAMVDPVFAKNQLILIMREWYMNPDGQIPAYEWAFSDVNPPVHAWAALHVYRMEKEILGQADLDFLKRVFQKLLINFTWWINRKDALGNSIFEGGFLGLDNIGVFDRSSTLPDGAFLEQADSTSWMGMYALNMMDIALEISMTDHSFEDVATKFYEHFVIIAEALNEMGLWDSGDHFFYDLLTLRDGTSFPIKVRSIVGLTSLFAASIFDKKRMEKLPDFNKRINWFRSYRQQAGKFLPNEQSASGDFLISLMHTGRLQDLLKIMLNEQEFLAPGGIRALSKYYQEHPYEVNFDGHAYGIDYEPGESTTALFGGNSNWRGPIWMPMNYMIIHALKKYQQFYGDTLKVEFPTGSGNQLSLGEVSLELSKRIIRIFARDDQGNRPIHGIANDFYRQPENADLLLFYEYFHGDTSRGVGASHQTGWTATIAELIYSSREDW